MSAPLFIAGVVGYVVGQNSVDCTPPKQPEPVLGGFSFSCSPGIGCHKENQPPGDDKSGIRYSNIIACAKACPDGNSNPLWNS